MATIIRLVLALVLANYCLCDLRQYIQSAQNRQLKQDTRPNILFIVADDMKMIDPPYAPPMPNLKKLAESGVTFENAHCCAPSCNPSRTCFLYGLPTTKTKVFQNSDDAANPSIKNLEHFVAYMKRQGYFTVSGQRIFHLTTEVDQQYDDKIGWVKPEGAFDVPKGSQISDPEIKPNLDFGIIDAPWKEHYDYIAVSRMLELMKEHKDKLGFYTFGLRSCHVPHYVPKEIADKIPQPPIYPPIPPDDFDDIPLSGQKQGNFTRADAEVCIAKKSVGDAFLTSYYGCMKMVDNLVGRLMSFVNKSPEPWFVVFTTDHGYHTMDKRRLSKYTGWTQSTQVPLILAGGKSVGGKTVSMPVSLVDLYKTFIDVAGGDQPLTHSPEGMSLYGVTANTGSRDAVVVTLNEEDKAVVTEDWQFISYNSEEFELYDKKNDVWNLENLADLFPEVVSELDKKQP